MSENNFEVGNIVEGKILKLKPFGAIVELDDSTQGLVHISQVANGFIQDINDYLKEGDMVKVKIISIDSENKKISLSIREAQFPQQTSRQRKPFNSNTNNMQKRNFSGDNSHSSNNNTTQETRSTAPVDPMAAFEDKLKEWNKQATERQAGLNKRNNRR